MIETDKSVSLLFVICIPMIEIVGCEFILFWVNTPKLASEKKSRACSGV